MFSKILRWSAVGLFTVVVLAFAAYLSDMHRAYTRIEGKSTVIPSPYGDIEYVEGGSGLPVLVIHGSGGGYDQGELMIDAFLSDDVHWIAPSRFGYLRSTFQEGATFNDQAHAYAALLDHLGIERVAVVALSHGGPSALLFATLYPERVSSLTLISTGVTALSTGDQADANLKGSALTTIYKHDLALLDRDDAVQQTVPEPDGRQRCRRLRINTRAAATGRPRDRGDESGFSAQRGRHVRQSRRHAGRRD